MQPTTPLVCYLAAWSYDPTSSHQPCRLSHCEKTSACRSPRPESSHLFSFRETGELHSPPGAQPVPDSVDSYGFPSTHSTSSSISSSGNFSSYYGDSVSDYSTAGSDIESVSSRTLPRPQGLMSSQIPPAPQSMMGQFSSKVSSSTQKKHKCKVCDKRFTRPSSLQTHMYSHTGEKRTYNVLEIDLIFHVLTIHSFCLRG